MKELLKKAILSQPIDDEDSRSTYSEIIRSSIIFLSIALLIGAVFSIFRGSSEYVFILAVLWPFYGLLPYWMSKSPKTIKLGLYIQLFSIALVGIAGSYLSNGINSPAFHTNLLLIIISGSYFGLRGVIFSWFYCLISGIAFIYLNYYDLLYSPYLVVSPLVVLGIFLIIYLSAGVFQSLSAFILLRNSEKLRHQLRETRNAKQALVVAREEFQFIADNIDIAFWLLSSDARQTLIVNNAYEAITELPRQSFIDTPLSFLEIVHPEDHAIAYRIFKLTRSEKAMEGEFRIITKSREEKWVWMKSKRESYSDNSQMRISTILKDISNEKFNELLIIRLNRTYKVLSCINQEIIKVKDQRFLLDSVCRIIVEEGGFKSAWIGIWDSSACVLQPYSVFGCTSEAIEEIAGLLSMKSQQNQDSTGQLSESKADTTSFINSGYYDEILKIASKNGIGTISVFPVRFPEHISGVLNIYGDQTYSFDQRELELFQELADDISFALDFIFKEHQRSTIENELSVKESLYRELFISTKSGIVVYQPIQEYSDFIIKDVNESEERIDRINRNEAIGKRLSEVFPEIAKSELFEVFVRVHQTGNRENYGPYFYKDSRVTGWRELYIYKLNSGELVSVITDLTDIKIAESQLKEINETLRLSEEKFSKAFFISPYGVFITKADDGVVTEVNSALLKIFQYEREDVIGKNTFELMIWDSEEKRGEYLRTLTNKGEVRDFTLKVNTKNGIEKSIKSNSKFIEIGNEKYIFSIIEDVTALIESKNALDVRDNILSAINYASEQILRHHQLDSTIDDILQRLAKASNAYEVFVYQNFVDSEGFIIADPLYEWVENRQFNGRLISDLPQINYNNDNFKDWANQLSNRNQVILNPKNFYDEQFSRFAYSFILLVPIFVRNEWWGFFGFKIHPGERSIIMDGNDVLQTAADLFGAAIERNKADLELEFQKDFALAISLSKGLRKAQSTILKYFTSMEEIDIGAFYMTRSDESLNIAEYINLSDRFLLTNALYSKGSTPYTEFFCERPIFHDFNDVSTNPNFLDLKIEGMKSFGVVPIMNEGIVLATLNLASRKYSSFSPNVRNIIESMAPQIGSLLARIQAEEELSKNRQNLQLLFDTLEDLIFILDLKGNIIHTNPIVVKRTKYPADMLIGKSIIELIPDEFSNASFELLHDVIHGKQDYSYLPLQNADGDIIYNETRIYFGTWDGRNVLFWITHDNTDKVRAASDLKESENLYNNLFENAHDAIYLALNNHIEYINPRFAELLGYNYEDFLEKNSDLENLLTKHSAAIIRNRTSNGDTAEHNSQQFEVEIYNKNGDLIEIELTTVDFIKKGIPASLGFIRDISIRKAAEREMIAAKEHAELLNNAKSHFLATISHELRTPLNGIIGFAQMLSSEIEDGEQSEMAEIIVQSGKRLMITLNQILDLTRLEADRIEVNPQELNLELFITERLKLFKPSAEEKNLTLNFFSSTNELIAICDKEHLTSILNNLVGNAIKYTNHGSVSVYSTIETIEDKRWISIKVADTGIGIPEDRLNIIFEDFRQASEGIGRGFEGTGLGLAITKKILERIGGKISVTSSMGEGSSFKVLVPLVVPDLTETAIVPPEKPKEALAKEPVLPEGYTKPTILLVEDEAINQMLVMKLIGNITDVDIVDSGEKAIEYCREKLYDLILMDINLGKGMTGIVATEIIKTNPAYVNTPIVALTAFAMLGDKEEFLRRGMTHYISKPFDNNEFMNTVLSLLNIIED